MWHTAQGYTTHSFVPRPGLPTCLGRCNNGIGGMTIGGQYQPKHPILYTACPICNTYLTTLDGATSWKANYQKNGRKYRRHITWPWGSCHNLLAVLHKMWITRNEVINEKNEQGMKLNDTIDLKDAIDYQLKLGKAGLASYAQRFSYIDKGRAFVDHLQVAEQKAWVMGIKVARQRSQGM